SLALRLRRRGRRPRTEGAALHFLPALAHAAASDPTPRNVEKSGTSRGPDPDKLSPIHRPARSLATRRGEIEARGLEAHWFPPTPRRRAFAPIPSGSGGSDVAPRSFPVPEDPPSPTSVLPFLP